MLKTILVCVVVAATGYYLGSSHGWHFRSYYAGKAIPQPAPQLTAQEISDDEPDFESANWLPATKEDALIFAETGEDDHCSKAWRDDALHPGWGFHFEKASMPGRAGICTWYRMRKVKDGSPLGSGFTRPGPRLATLSDK
jgi:hypothetical protein